MKISIVSFSGRSDGNCSRIAAALRQKFEGEHQVTVFDFSVLSVTPCGRCRYECFQRRENCPYFSDAEFTLWDTIFNSDTLFHMEIAKASRNRLLISTMENAKEVFQAGIYRAFQVDTASNVAQALQFHEEILDAIIRKDCDAAYTLMRRHIESVNERGG